MEDDVYTIPQVAKICSVSRTTIWRWVKSGKLKASMTLGGQHRISGKNLKPFLVQNSMYPVACKDYKRKRILIIDDTIVQEIICKILSLNNYLIETASDGFEGGIKVIQFKPDLIILDLIMPGMDGFDVCRKLKENSTTSHINILILTDYDTKENRDRIMEAGANSFLSKPVRKESLLEHVENLLAVSSP